jgi:hypothetical protein
MFHLKEYIHYSMIHTDQDYSKLNNNHLLVDMFWYYLNTIDMHIEYKLPLPIWYNHQLLELGWKVWWQYMYHLVVHHILDNIICKVQYLHQKLGMLLVRHNRYFDGWSNNRLNIMYIYHLSMFYIQNNCSALLLK